MFLSRSPHAAQPEARRPHSLLDAGFLYRILSLGGARGVMVIVVGIGHNDTSSSPGPDCLHFT